MLEAGGRRIHRDVRTAYSYAAANDPRIHVGLGQLDGVRDVTVRWPGGRIEAFGNYDANREVVLRRGADDRPFKTDGGHFILDCQTLAIPEPVDVARHLRRIPGVIEHGLFVDLARSVIVGAPNADDTEIVER